MDFDEKVNEQIYKQVFENFKHYVWFQMGKPTIDDFGGKLVNELKGEYAKRLVIKYVGEMLRHYIEVLHK